MYYGNISTLSSVFPLFEAIKKVMAPFKAPESAFLPVDLDLEVNIISTVYFVIHL